MFGHKVSFNNFNAIKVLIDVVLTEKTGCIPLVIEIIPRCCPARSETN
jgi:hypothetical protein